jgi:hypothetical protein
VEPGEESARPSTHESSYRKQAQQLKRLLAEKTLEVDFFKRALQKVEARRQKSGASLRSKDGPILHPAHNPKVVSSNQTPATIFLV